MNVVLNPELEKLVNEKVGSGYHQTQEAMVEEALKLLTARDRAEDRLKALLQEAEDSRPPVEMTEQDWTDIRTEALAKLKTRQPS